MKKRIRFTSALLKEKKGIVFFCLLFLFSPFASGAENISQEHFRSTVQILIVEKKDPSRVHSIANGVFVGNEMHIISQYRSSIKAVRESETYKAIGCISDGKTKEMECIFNLKVIEKDPPSHIVIFQVENVHFSQEIMSRQEYLEQTEKKHSSSNIPACLNYDLYSLLNTFDAVEIFGLNIKPYSSKSIFKGVKTSYYHSSLDAVPSYTFQTSSSFYPGAPIFNTQGELLGIITAYGSGSVSALPIGEIRNIMQEKGFGDISPQKSEQYCEEKQKKTAEEKQRETPQKAPEYQQHLLPSVVQIQVVERISRKKTGGSGSGVFLFDTEEIYLLTNHHVIANAKGNLSEYHVLACVSGKIGDDSDCIFETRIVASDPAHDLALLRVNKVFLEEKELSPQQYLAQKDIRHRIIPSVHQNDFLSLLTQNTELFIYGYPALISLSQEKVKNTPFVLTQTPLKKVYHSEGNTKEITIFTGKGEVISGNSGGPVFSKKGDFLGLVYAIGKIDANDTSGSLILSLPLIQRFLADIDFSFLLEREKKELPEKKSQEEIKKKTLETKIQAEKNKKKTSQKEETPQTDILQKKLKTVIIEGIVACKQEYPSNKKKFRTCIKGKIISFLKAKSKAKRLLRKYQ